MGNAEKFLYGGISTIEPEGVSDFLKNRHKVEVEINSDEFVSDGSQTNFPVLDKVPVQTAGVSEVLERNLDWSKALPFLRKMWGCTQVEMAELLGISDKTILNIEKDNSKPNLINRRKLFQLKELTDLLIRFVGRKYAVNSFVNSELPALGMLTPKSYLKGWSNESFYEVLGLVKRIYR